MTFWRSQEIRSEIFLILKYVKRGGKINKKGQKGRFKEAMPEAGAKKGVERATLRHTSPSAVFIQPSRHNRLF